MRKCTCPCGCTEDVEPINPFDQCEECTHGDCGVSGFEDEKDLILHEGGE